MEEELTIDELAAEARRARALAAVCRKYGWPQASAIHDATASACEREVRLRNQRD